MAIEGFDIEVRKGEVRGLIGPNGAGKTTLFNVIAGLLRPSSGQTLFEGEDVSGHSAHQLARLGIRRTFQNLQLFRDMTVLQNVIMGLHTRGRAEVFAALLRTGGQRREERWMSDEALRTLEFIGLSDEAQTRASALPYGRMRMLEVGRALVSQPKLLLLDEPAAGLNASECLTLVDLIDRIQERGITVMLVEHRMDVVMRACGTITVLNYGHKLAEGSPAAIQANSEVVEAYLGRSGTFTRRR
ncbi:MAG TPA: ABC transporter ATP-binding protein [Candidatus Methylomirabilis sp.]|nr:ABC transporter ATP-binding protein [Candidatus Methylomirabilis sp.]